MLVMKHFISLGSFQINEFFFIFQSIWSTGYSLFSLSLLTVTDSFENIIPEIIEAS